MFIKGQKYALYEVGTAEGSKRRFLFHPDGRINELRRVFDQTVGREAIVLKADVPYGIGERLLDINNFVRSRDCTAIMPPPIWDYSLAHNSELTVVELHRIPDLFAEGGFTGN